MQLQSDKEQNNLDVSRQKTDTRSGSFFISSANAMPVQDFPVSESIYHELVLLYGSLASKIARTDRIELKAPDIAENGAVVGVTVSGEKGLVSSLAIFVEQNPLQLASTCTLHQGTDLAMSVRLKVRKTSDIIVVAKTKEGLVGVRKEVKVTIGCGGG